MHPARATAGRPYSGMECGVDSHGMVRMAGACCAGRRWRRPLQFRFTIINIMLIKLPCNSDAFRRHCCLICSAFIWKPRNHRPAGSMRAARRRSRRCSRERYGSSICPDRAPIVRRHDSCKSGKHLVSRTVILHSCCITVPPSIL